jgi:hypothetical protein
MVTFKGSSRFFIRNSAGKHQMDVTEIRSAFLLSEGVADRVRRFRERRIATILSEETPVPLESRSMIVLHLIPMTDHSLAMQNVLAGAGFSPFGDRAIYSRHNIDGFLMHGDCNPKCNAYCQVFRTGALETVNCDYASSENIPLRSIEEDVIKSLRQYLPALDSLGVPFPLVLACSLLGVKGKGLPQNSQFFRRPVRSEYDRDQVHFPDVLIEAPKADLPKVLKPVYDAMWQGMGVPQSPSYDKEGKWTP